MTNADVRRWDQKRCSPVTRASTTSHNPLTVSPAMVMNLSNVTPG